MGKFGKKVTVSTNINDYMIGVMAPSGFGKTTLMYQVCEKEFGPDGYIILDMGTEDGVSAIEGATAEPVPTWKKMKEVVDDIVKNKATEYPDLKVVILDTLDAAFEIAEIYTIDSWNRENIGKKDFTKSTSINSVEGGFGRGMDRVIDTVKKEIVRLESVGVKTYWTSHVKEKDQSDLFTGANYTSLTANMPMKYFNSIKNSSHVVAFGYFDRSIEKHEVGDANPVTKKKKERKAVVDETRKIKFRDDALVADAKSRFAHIIDEINLDADEFIKAIKDAIEAEKNATKVTAKKKPVKKVEVVEEEPTEEETVEEDPIAEEVIEETEDIFAEEAEDITPVASETLTAIRTAFKTADADTKAEVKVVLGNYGGKLANEMRPSDVKKIEAILGLDDEV
jgi:GTPase SAR1 family protein